MKILEARHSPIRRLFFSFYIECPYWVSVHLVRYIHAQPYVKSQRNDRQSDYDRNKASQDETVCMILDMNAEELITIANKRLCNQASDETHELVPMCVREHGCHEMFSCNKPIGLFLVVLGAYNFDTTKNRTQQWLKGVQEQQRTLARTAKSLYLQGNQVRAVLGVLCVLGTFHF